MLCDSPVFVSLHLCTFSDTGKHVFLAVGHHNFSLTAFRFDVCCEDLELSMSSMEVTFQMHKFMKQK